MGGGQLDLNDALARAGPQKGEPSRNPTGWNNPPARLRNREIRALLIAGLADRCEWPGYEHLTKREVGIHALLDKWMRGERWAMKFVADRVWGPVPLQVDMEVSQSPDDLTNLSLDDLLARVETIRATLLAPAPEQSTEATDAVLVEGDEVPDAPQG